MAFPSFSASGVTTFTFSRGYLFPVAHQYDVRQLVGISEGSASTPPTITVATLSAATDIMILQFQLLTLTDYTGLVAFFTAINWRARSFTFTDVASNTHTVRLWDAQFAASEIHANRFNVQLTLRKETL